MHSSSEQNKETLAFQSLPILPAPINLEDLEANGKLLTDEQIQAAQQYFASFPLPTTVMPSRRDKEKKIFNHYRVPLPAEAVEISRKKSLSSAPPKNIDAFLPENKKNISLLKIVINGEEKILARYKTLAKNWQSTGKKEKKNPRLIGEGSYGKVKLAQDIITGEWYAIKVEKQGYESPVGENYVNCVKTTPAKAHNEVECLNEVGLRSVLFFKENTTILNRNAEEGFKWTEDKFIVVMPLVKGLPFLSLVKTYSLSLHHLFNMAYKIFGEYQEKIQAKDLLHRDIHIGNVLFCPITNTVNFIDFSNSVKLRNGEKKYSEVAGNTGSVTAKYVEPFELRSKPKYNITSEKIAEIAAMDICGLDRPRNNYKYEYNEKTEIFGLGFVVAIIFGLFYREKDKEYLAIAPVDMPCAEFCQIKDDELRKTILLFLHKMCDSDPENRPTVAEAKTFFEKIAINYFATEEGKRKVIFLYHSDYNKFHGKESWKDIVAQLKQADEVVIIDDCPTSAPTVYLALTKNLDKEGIFAQKIFPAEESVDKQVHQNKILNSLDQSVSHYQHVAIALNLAVSNSNSEDDNQRLVERTKPEEEQRKEKEQEDESDVESSRSIEVVPIDEEIFIEEKMLPYVPVKINFDELQANGKLLTDQQITAAEKYIKENKTAKALEVSHQKTPDVDFLPSKYVSLLAITTQKGEERIFARYKTQHKKEKRLLGAGGFGAVKLMQDIKTGEWYALKVERAESPYERSPDTFVKVEFEVLQKLDLGFALHEKHANEHGHVYLMAMKLIKGRPLSDFNSNELTLSLHSTLATISGIFNAYIKKLAKHKILHKDIKNANIMVDPANNRVDFIDFNTAVFAPEGTYHYVGCHSQDNPCITKIFAAPEISKTHQFNEKTEVYALAVTLFYLLKINDLNEFSSRSPITDTKLQAQVRNYLKIMMDGSPDKRPTIKQAQQFFAEIAKIYLNKPEGLRKVAFVCISDYIEYKNNSAWQYLKNSLALADEVIVIDDVHSPGPLTYLNFRQELEKANIYLSDKMYAISPKMSRVAALQTIAQHISMQHVYYFPQINITEAETSNIPQPNKLLVLPISLSAVSSPIKTHKQALAQHAQLCASGAFLSDTEMPVANIISNIDGKEKIISRVYIKQQSFPYTPAKINLAELEDNGKLLTDEQIAAAKVYFSEQCSAENPFLVLSRKAPSLPENIDDILPENKNVSLLQLEVEGKKRIFARYKTLHGSQRWLGAGGTAAIKIMQDLETGEWYVLKRPTSENYSNYENTILQQQQQSIGKFVKNSSAGVEARHYLAMKWLPGTTLVKIPKPSLNTALLMINSSLASYAIQIEQQGLLHRDIKNDNILFNRASGTCRFIDFGFSLYSAKREVSNENIVGNPYFLAPEVGFPILGNVSYNALYNVNASYNEATEVFALGRTLALALKLGNFKANVTTVNKFSKPFIFNTKNSLIKDAQLSTEISQYLQKMTHSVPAKRPTMAEARKYFQRLADNYLTTPQGMRKVAFVFLSDYVNQNDNEKNWEKIKKNLALADEVIIINNVKDVPQKIYAQLQQECAKDNIYISDKMFTVPQGASNTEVLNSISEKIDRDCPGNLNLYYYPSQDITEDKKSLNKVLALDIYHKNPQQVIATYSKHCYLTKAQLYVVVQELMQDKQRLIEKYGKNDAENTRRIELMNAAILNFQQAYQNNALSWDKLNTDLKALQNQMVGRTFLGKVLGYSSSAKTVKTTLKKVAIIQKNNAFHVKARKH